MNKKGVVVSQSMVVIFTIIILVVLSIIFAKAVGIFTATGDDKKVLDFYSKMEREFNDIKGMGYNSRLEVSIPAIDYQLCFVDLDYKEDVKNNVPSKIQVFVGAEGQKDDVYLVGRDEMLDVGNITIDSNGDEQPNTGENAFLCINASNFFQFSLTNRGNSVMVSKK